MSPDRWEHLRALFDAAISKEPAERERLIAELAQSEPETTVELQKLLASHACAGSFLQQAPIPIDSERGSTLAVGSVFAERYQILQTLGMGGMGTVYKAFDQVVERLVALKVIRGDLAERPEVRERFRRELVFARKIVHRNVIRIFDLGVWEKSRFITMEFIDGETLADRLQVAGRLAPHDAAGIMLQVASGLEAAHGEGVVHRDLKPQNIMLDKQGRALVMDFGIARGVEQPTLTHTAQLMGTPDYMSPEQARGEPAEAASDIFSFGVVFHELLLGDVPFRAENPMASLLKRTREAAPPLSTLDPAIPKELSRIVQKCLAVESGSRYVKGSELVEDLRTWDKPALRSVPKSVPRRPPHVAALVAVFLLLTAGAAYYFQRTAGQAPASPKTLRMLVADFDNVTGDPQLDGTIEPVLSLAMEDSSFITQFNRVTARTEASKLEPGAVRLTESAARLVAIREGIDVVLVGSILRKGDRYVLRVKPIDSTSGHHLDQREVEAARRSEILNVIARLAGSLRRMLGDRTLAEPELAAETFTAGSIEAAHLYAKAQELALAGTSDEEAIRLYRQVIAADPNMGRAYAGMAVLYRNATRTEEAVQAFQQALSHYDRMTERERYRTRGGYYVTIHNQQKAAEEFRALVEKYPADTAGHANLALASLFLRDTTKALAEGRMAVQIYPKNLRQRNNVAFYAMYAGDLEAAAREARSVIEIDSQFEKAYRALALAEFVAGHKAEAMDAYRRLEPLSGMAAAVANLGYADIALYEGKYGAAVDLLRTDLAANRALKGQIPAIERVTMAQVLLAQGKPAEALAQVERALFSGADESVLYPAAMVYIAAGASPKAMDVASKLEARLGQEPRIYAKLIQGEAQLQAHNPKQAVSLFSEAQAIIDTWLGHFHLGRAYLAAGAFAEASSEFETCTRRRGEASAVFLDDLPSYRYYAPVLYYQARAEEGLKSPGASETYTKFLSLRETDDGSDALRADAQRRLRTLVVKSGPR
ncbi:MAG TPA: protein kinase [Bryobacteraceae bacterium]|jgi:tetratricopeptide (TPR) repeat protein|nr:protein kinase [Bryobacteraceae bacterium]